jgi:hypothetical protein
MKFTEWYPGHIKPFRKGVYQQRCGQGREIGYQKWDGTRWSDWYPTIEGAEKSKNFAISCNQNDPWRGLTKEMK